MSTLRQPPTSIEYVVLDWHGALTQRCVWLNAALHAAGERMGLQADWDQLQVAWRLRVVLHMTQQGLGTLPWCAENVMLDDALCRTLGDLGIQEARFPREVRAAVVAAWGALPLWPDAQAALRRLTSKFRLAFCSRSDSSALDLAAAMAALPVERVIGSEMLRQSPTTACYFTGVARLLRRSAERLLYVSDDGPQMTAATVAGWRTAVVTRQCEALLLPQAELRATYAATSLLELAEQLVPVPCGQAAGPIDSSIGR